MLAFLLGLERTKFSALRCEPHRSTKSLVGLRALSVLGLLPVPATALVLFIVILAVVP